MPAKTATAGAKGPRTDTGREGDGAVPPARSRLVRGWAVALVGAALGVGFGAGIEKMMFGPPLIMVALGGMTLGLSGLALWRVIDPLTRPEATLGREARGPGRARELEREKQAVLKAIKEIELDHQMRKIADADYRELVERYRGRAMRLISEIEAGDNFRELIERELKDRLIGDKLAPPPPTFAAPALPVASAAAAPAPATAPARHACGGCGTTNDDDAQFCKKCGLKLAA